MIQVFIKDNESGDRLLKRFFGHIKSRGFMKSFRKKRYNRKAPTKTQIRQAAVVRERYRAVNKRKMYESS